MGVSGNWDVPEIVPELNRRNIARLQHKSRSKLVGKQVGFEVLKHAIDGKLVISPGPGLLPWLVAAGNRHSDIDRLRRGGDRRRLIRRRSLDGNGIGLRDGLAAASARLAEATL